MEEHLFIAYANLPLFDDPGKLDELLTQSHSTGEAWQLSPILRAMKTFHAAACEDGAAVCLQRQPDNLEQIAYEAVYGYVGRSCKECEHADSAEHFSWIYPDRRRPYCFECRQEQFRHQLGFAIRERFDIETLRNFTFPAKEVVQVHIDVSSEAQAEKYRGGNFQYPVFGLEEKISVDQTFLSQLWGPPHDPYFDRFNFFLDGIVSFDLLYFLRHSNKDLIKLCPVCDRFFISARASRKYCSIKCHDDFHKTTEATKQAKRRYWQKTFGNT